MTPAEKLAKIEARDFTYVSVSYFTSDHDLRFDRFVVLSGSTPVARQAAQQIALARLPEGAHLATELLHGRRDSAVSIYVKNYVRDCKRMAREHPEDVYAVESTTTISVSA